MRRAELVERVGGLEAEAEWSHVLSLGEQQRVAFLRLLLHAPKLAFLDEATGALDSATEAALYTRLRSYCTSYISVGGWLTAAARLQDIHCFTDLHMGPWAWHAAMSSQVHVRRWQPLMEAVFWAAGHRMELLQYHTHVLEHVGATRWQLSTVEEFRARQAAR